MTNYEDFISDFPERCLENFKRDYKSAKRNNREVTLLLTFAAAGFVIPFERLRNNARTEHPFADRDKYKKAADEFDKLTGQNIKKSTLIPNISNWRYEKRKESTKLTPSEIESWSKQCAKSISETEKDITVLSVIRHAFAHGGILILTNPIEELVFISYDERYNKKKQSYDYKYSLVAASVEDFTIFLEKWVDFLKKLPKYK